MKQLLITAVALLPLMALERCPRKEPVVVPKAAESPAREERSVITYAGEAGKTALELLRSHAKVRTRKSDLGELVEEINGIANQGNRYLFFFVNGSMAGTGAANYITQTGDRIEWKLISRK